MTDTAPTPSLADGPMMAGTAIDPGNAAMAEAQPPPESRPDDAPPVDELDDGSLPDEVKLMPGGRSRLVISGAVYLLNPANMGTIREVRERLVDIDNVPVPPVGDRDGQMAYTATVEPMVLDLGRFIVERTSRTRTELGRDEDLPAWLGTTAWVYKVLGHWRAVPQVPGR